MNIENLKMKLVAWGYVNADVSRQSKWGLAKSSQVGPVCLWGFVSVKARVCETVRLRGGVTCERRCIQSNGQKWVLKSSTPLLSKPNWKIIESKVITRTRLFFLVHRTGTSSRKLVCLGTSSSYVHLFIFFKMKKYFEL